MNQKKKPVNGNIANAVQRSYAKMVLFWEMLLKTVVLFKIILFWQKLHTTVCFPNWLFSQKLLKTVILSKIALIRKTLLKTV